MDSIDFSIFKIMNEQGPDLVCQKLANDHGSVTLFRITPKNFSIPRSWRICWANESFPRDVMNGIIDGTAVIYKQYKRKV